ncbi:MAG TPA: copper homeostasis membrane protein CopD [Casimicrobiaceae bacterium]|nr:copper homeostasis membrane protein CopD [Casimicrobiaceae bacterium]
MNVVFVACRAVHFGAAMLVFGELAFAVFVAPAEWRSAIAGELDRRRSLDRHVRAFTAWALAASAVSGIAWVALEASAMSGGGLMQVLADGTLAVVLRQTEFGHVFAVRAVLLVGVAATLAWLWRASTRTQSRLRAVIALGLAGLYLATLAGAGHAAAATEGVVRVVHLGADACHLLAAGGWIGALPALVHCFAHASSNAALAQLARRFSVLGIVCVAVLMASGVVNTLFLVGSFAALFGTAYGNLLVVKLALFAAMLVLAAINRSRLTPRLADGDASAGRALRRNAMLEITIGVVIVAIVGALGTMVPGAHQSPVWPFAFAFDFSPATRSPEASGALWASLLLALAAIALIIAGVYRKSFRLWIPGCVALVVCAAASTSILAVPAFPTTYASSPVPYAVDAVARGAARYASDCSSCHGAGGRGDGPAAAGLSARPANLAEHALHHPPGNLFWWIAHGIPGTPMPAFSPKLSDTQIWELVQFLVARASARSAQPLGPLVNGKSMSRAPDFTYELPGEEQRTLNGQRTPALIVLYSLPQSKPRLTQLASDHRIMHANLRVLAIPLPGSHPTDDANVPVDTIRDADVTAVYAMFAGTAGTSAAAHVELLVDATGIVRARWTGVPGTGTDRDAQITAAAQRLPEPSRMPASMHHGR